MLSHSSVDTSRVDLACLDLANPALASAHPSGDLGLGESAAAPDLRQSPASGFREHLLLTRRARSQSG